MELSASTYQYRELLPTNGIPWIRLLEIMPAQLNANSFSFNSMHSPRVPEPLRCRIRHIQLKDPMPHCDALSYYWGSTEDPVTIECSDEFQRGTVEITQNLHAALLAVRNRMSSWSKYFWADGICMHQTKEEKNVQVPLMLDI